MIKEFPYTSFEQYLEIHGLRGREGDTLVAAKRRYRTLYQKYYRRQSRAKQVNLLMPESDYDHLENKAKTHGLKKATQYLLHLLRNDREGKGSLPPNMLVEIEVGILKSIDGLSKLLRAQPETRGKVLHIIQQLEELLKLLGS
ncbi:MAG: hypothetical protein NXI10_03580 [bacterium]|nr:hypothetical protein [bacterium]